MKQIWGRDTPIQRFLDSRVLVLPLVGAAATLIVFALLLLLV